MTHRKGIFACALLAAQAIACSSHEQPTEDVARAPGALVATDVNGARLFGAAVSHGPLASEPAYAATLAAEFDYVTPENELKWGSLQSAPAQWDFTRADAIVAFAAQHGQAIKGHTLVWHNQLPAFIGDSLSPSQLKTYMKDHIRKVVRRYAGQIRAWDVVNEAVAEDGTLRDTVFSRKLGAEYIEQAFAAAHSADPQALLYYNDYGIETINPKSDAVYALVQGLLAADVPIHGVGFQSHFEAQNAPSTEALAQNLQRFADLGLRVNVSELDVRVQNVMGDHPTKLGVQKQAYERVVAACLQVAGCESLTTWGFTDKYSWVDSVFGADDPLEFDELYGRKPAYYGIVEAFAGVPAEEPGTPPNLIGNSSFEAGGDGWFTWGGSVASSDAQAHSGLRSALVSERTETWHGAVYDVRSLVAPGRTYDVGAWARLGAGAQADAALLSAKVRCAGGIDDYPTLGSSAASDSEWALLSGELVVPDCALEELSIYVQGPAAGVDLFVDDVALRPRPGDLGPNLIANSGFETDASGWFGFDVSTIVASAAQAYAGTQSGSSSNRTASWQGPAYSLLGKAVPGSKYQTSAWVRLEGAALSQTIMTLKATCAGVDNYIRVGSASANDHGWTLLTGSFVVPNCALSGLTLYFEGPAPGVSLYIDEISVRRDLSVVPANLVQNSGFESGASGWFGFGGPTVSASNAQAHSGSFSGLVSGRTATWQGPAYSLLGAGAGGTYRANAWVRLRNQSAAQVHMTRKTKCGTVESFARVGTANATDSGWAEIAGTFSVADCALSEFVVYFEGPAGGVEFYIDDVSVLRQP